MHSRKILVPAPSAHTPHPALASEQLPGSVSRAYSATFQPCESKISTASAMAKVSGPKSNS